MSLRRTFMRATFAGVLVAFAAAAATETSIDAGPDQTARISGPVYLTGTVRDSEPPFLTIGWSKTEGPGEVVFGKPHAERTTVTFSEPGEYELMLGGFDGSVFYDTVRITVTR